MKAPAPKTQIWHYMDFTNLVAMYEEQGIFFSRADTLDDQFEGSISKPHKAYAINGRNLNPEEYAQYLKSVRACSYVHCWHMNDHESAAMWKLYSSMQNAVAIQSTYERLRKALPEQIQLGTVAYISYEDDDIPFGNPFWPLMHKRRSFEHERELRALYGDLNRVNNEGEAPERWKLERVRLEGFIEKLYVSPWSKEWFYELVKRVTKRYGLSIEVHRSALGQEPIF